METKPKIVVIVGPTATGKSDLAVVLARRFNGEVISADSRQVFRGLTIGTGKITKKEMDGIPHHLLDVADPKKQFSVADYVALANPIVTDIVARGKLPIVCGGTGFYIKALIENTTLPDVPPDRELRKRLEGKSASELYTMLTWLDRERANTIDAQNPRRLIRAIEIAKHLGSVPALAPGERRFETLTIGLSLPPDKLKSRIRIRLEKRLKVGMIREAKQLHTKGLSWKRMEALGLEYRFLARFLTGKLTRSEMIEKLNTEIWHYAKRQMTWFRRDKTVIWISPRKRKEALSLVREFLK
jgi:tRNA dimethylallyltransferase